LYNSLAQQTSGVESEPKYQATAPAIQNCSGCVSTALAQTWTCFKLP